MEKSSRKFVIVRVQICGHDSSPCRGWHSGSGEHMATSDQDMVRGSSAAASDAALLTLKADSARDLATRLARSDLLGIGPMPIPWGTAPSLDSFRQAVAGGAVALPWPYQSAYVGPLQASLNTILYATIASGGSDPAETLLGAVYDHQAGSPVVAPLRRCNVTIADFSRSFLAHEKRARLSLPLVERLPPLATFRRDGALGPYTYPADVVSNIIGADVAIVSMPSTYAGHPLVWAALAHETGGHDIVHAI